MPLTVEAIRENLNDVAGVRVICAFIDDIYKVADLSEFVNQDTSIEVSSLAKSEQEIIRLWRKTPSDVKNALKCILKKFDN